jgi:hypothetical protein
LTLEGTDKSHVRFIKPKKVSERVRKKNSEKIAKMGRQENITFEKMVSIA